LRRVEMDKGEVGAGQKQLVDHAERADDDHHDDNEACEPCTGIDPAFSLRQQQWQRKREWHRQACGVDQNADGRAVVGKDKDRQTGKGQRRNRGRLPPGRRLAVKPPDAHRRKANRENRRRAGK
jgi:hypothetical protein